jgi:hypothetical protein
MIAAGAGEGMGMDKDKSGGLERSGHERCVDLRRSRDKRKPTGGGIESDSEETLSTIKYH